MLIFIINSCKNWSMFPWGLLRLAPTIQKFAKDLSDMLHSNGFVHGDLRSRNIIYEVKYPASLNMENNKNGIKMFMAVVIYITVMMSIN